MSQVRIIVEAVESFIEKVVKSIVLDVVANLVRAPGEGGTPVDTGWARANWVPNIDSPNRDGGGNRARGSRISQTPGRRAEQQEGIASVATRYKLGQTVYISNNVPYIVRLDQGSSTQAPSGFVQRAIIKAINQDLASKLGA